MDSTFLLTFDGKWEKSAVYWHKWLSDIFPLLVSSPRYNGWILLLLSFHLIPFYVICSKIGGERATEGVSHYQPCLALLDAKE